MPYKDPAKNAACKRAWYLNNKEKEHARVREWNKNNPEWIKEYQKQYNKKNATKKAEQSKNWRENNRAKYNSLQAKRRAIKLQATPLWLTKKQINEINEYYVMAKELEKVFPWPQHVDHIFALQGFDICGLHVPWNLQILSQKANLEKGNRSDLCSH